MMNSEIPLSESVDLQDFVSLVERFDGRDGSVFHGYETVRRFAQDLMAEGNETLRVVDILELARSYSVEGNDLLLGDENPLTDLAKELREQWTALVEAMPMGDRLDALIVLCGAGGLYEGRLTASVFAALVLAVLTFRGAREIVN